MDYAGKTHFSIRACGLHDDRATHADQNRWLYMESISTSARVPLTTDPVLRVISCLVDEDFGS